MFGKKDLLRDGDFILIQSRVSNLELEIEKMKTHINSLRGLINRKRELVLDGKEKIEEKETSKYDDGLNSLRT